MNILILVSVLISAWIDFFFISAFESTYYVYTGIIIIMLLLRHRHENQALYASLVYGLIMDLFVLSSPFGTFMIIHILLWMLLRPILYNLVSSNNRSTVLIVFAASLVYSFVLSGVTALNGSINIFSIQSSIGSALLNTVAAYGIININKLGIRIADRWLFLHKSNT